MKIWMNVMNWCLVSKFCPWSFGLGQCLPWLPFLLNNRLSSVEPISINLKNRGWTYSRLFHCVGMSLCCYTASVWAIGWKLEWSFGFFSLNVFIMIRLDHLPIVCITGVYFIVLNISVWNFTYTVGSSLPLLSGIICWCQQLLEDRKHPEPISASISTREE